MPAHGYARAKVVDIRWVAAIFVQRLLRISKLDPIFPGLISLFQGGVKLIESYLAITILVYERNNFLHNGHREFSFGNFIAAAILGAQLSVYAGSYKHGAAAFRAVFVSIFGSTTSIEGLEAIKHLLPDDLTAHLREEIQEGAPACYDGPRGTRRLGLPYKFVTKAHVGDWARTIWKGA